MIQHISKPFVKFFKLEASSGIMLLLAAILALVISNGALSEQYFSILQKKIILGNENFGFWRFLSSKVDEILGLSNKIFMIWRFENLQLHKQNF